jgi:P27 family predicted phage terminase small subunit
MPGTRHSGGRNKKSAEAHALEGTYQKSRHDGVVTPTPPTGRPVPPVALVDDALAEWERMIARLEASKTLSLVDDAVIYQYAHQFAETEAIARGLAYTTAAIAEYESKSGGIDEDSIALRALELKYIGQLRQGRATLRQYLVELGMTPSARTRVTPVGDKPTKERTPLEKLRAQIIRIK